MPGGRKKDDYAFLGTAILIYQDCDPLVFRKRAEDFSRATFAVKATPSGRFPHSGDIFVRMRVFHLLGDKIGGKPQLGEQKSADLPESDMPAQQNDATLALIGFSKILQPCGDKNILDIRLFEEIKTKHLDDAFADMHKHGVDPLPNLGFAEFGKGLAHIRYGYPALGRHEPPQHFAEPCAHKQGAFARQTADEKTEGEK
ncbi:MAG: hypothetical protein R2864_07640 [Syntrophotaleaceae bacterium]